MSLLHLYRKPALSLSKKNDLLSIIKQRVSSEIGDLETEYCFNIETSESLTPKELDILCWLLSETFEPGNFSDKSFLGQSKEHSPPSLPSPSRGGGGFFPVLFVLCAGWI